MTPSYRDLMKCHAAMTPRPKRFPFVRSVLNNFLIGLAPKELASHSFLFDGQVTKDAPPVLASFSTDHFRRIR